MTDNADVPPEVPSLPEPSTPNTPDPGEPNPPLPDPGPRDGTHTHDGESGEPDIGDAFADGFQHPDE